MPLDLPSLRRQFPFLHPASGQPPVYLDNAATTQKPAAVIDAVRAFYEKGFGNVHRGMHRHAEQATDAYEAARERVRAFIGAERAENVIFTKNATESIQLVASSWARAHLRKGDAVVLSVLEHHSNIVPWLQLREERGIDLRWIDADKQGFLREDDLHAALRTGRVRLVALTGQSNVLGIRPSFVELRTSSLERWREVIHASGARLLVDAAQLAAHAPIDVQRLGCDFLAFSGHKVYGPGGIGVLYATDDALREMRPPFGGGGSVRSVRRDGFEPADAPACFEAGTPPVADAVGLAAALDWQAEFRWEDRIAHEKKLLAHALQHLGKIEGLRILGPADPEQIHGCISFVIKGIHPHDLTDLLGQKGIALRAGNHCAEPLHVSLGIPASTRLSVGLYNTVEEMERMAEEIEDVRRKFSE